ncbi:MAG: calcium/sodium antiporter [Gemmatimonadota bacterium]
MLIPTLFLVGGIGLLWVAAEWLIHGAASLGRAAGIPSIVIGLTVVSMGTSAPELVVSALAALRGSPDLAAGNVFGSNLANIGLILGLAALMKPLTVAAQAVRREVPWMLAVTLITYPLMLNLRMGRVEGFILAALLFVYLVFLIRLARREAASLPPSRLPGSETAGAEAALEQMEEMNVGGSPGAARGSEGAHPRPWGRASGLRAHLPSIALVIVGVAGLVVGGRGIVIGATEVARLLGVPEVLLGLSVVAVGTSLPELATTVIAALRGESDLAVGNIVGSNIFNLTFVLGGTALLAPISVNPLLLRVEYPAVLLLSLIILPMARSEGRIARWEGVLLLLLYVAAWVWILYARAVFA